MDQADDEDEVFVYMGGDQAVPLYATHVRVHKSVKIITRRAFMNCRKLVSIEMHDGVEIIEGSAFYWCTSLRSIKLPGVRIIESRAFAGCNGLEEVEFGNKLETIGECAFGFTGVRNMKLPKVRVIENYAFSTCEQLTEVELSEDLERIRRGAFQSCSRLRRITFPLKNNLLGIKVFNDCDHLSQIELIGGIHKTVSSLLLDSWRNEMNDEIDLINQALPYTDPHGKVIAIQRWFPRLLERIRHYKREHYALMKEDMTLLELALWMANIPNNVVAADRQQARVTCGANIIIPHVLSFLNNDDIFPLFNQNA